MVGRALVVKGKGTVNSLSLSFSLSLLTAGPTSRVGHRGDDTGSAKLRTHSGVRNRTWAASRRARAASAASICSSDAPGFALANSSLAERVVGLGSWV